MQALVIDDSSAMRKILTRMLRELGFEVAEAGNGREGLTYLEQQGRPRLALVDWNMPEMDGMEFLLTVRANRVYDDMRVMMVTTETEWERVSKALGAGADEYVMKPFTRDVIREKLDLLGVLPG